MAKSPKVTPFQRKCLEAIRRGLNGSAVLDEISERITGDTKHRLAIASALRHLLRTDEDGFPSDSGDLVCRIGPKDQWGNERWCLTDAGYALLGYALVEGQWVKTEAARVKAE